jgi:hypothetical protein
MAPASEKEYEKQEQPAVIAGCSVYYAVRHGQRPIHNHRIAIP